MGERAQLAKFASVFAVISLLSLGAVVAWNGSAQDDKIFCLQVTDSAQIQLLVCSPEVRDMAIHDTIHFCITVRS